MSCCASRGVLRSPDLQGDLPAGQGRPSAQVLACADATPPLMILFGGGASHTGTHDPAIPQDGEGVIGEYRLRPFSVDAHLVTNARFAAFVAETGYLTTSERVGHGLVLRHLLDRPGDLPPNHGPTPWWAAMDGACWHSPEGIGSTILERMDHPVTHVSWEDAKAFAKWAGGRLPTEAEWEHAARGGLADPRFPWGDQEPDDREFLPANLWQGPFPHANSRADGYAGTSPVASFPANGAGLFDMAGNVWEWTADPFRIRSGAAYAIHRNADAQRRGQRVMKGGSFLCHVSYCYRYRIAARSATEPDSGAANCGLRVFYDS